MDEDQAYRLKVDQVMLAALKQPQSVECVSEVRHSTRENPRNCSGKQKKSGVRALVKCVHDFISWAMK